MLLERSPNLQELTIHTPSSSNRSFQMQPLITGRWPKLRNLTLGDFVINTLHSSPINVILTEFLIHHPTLRSFTLHRPRRPYPSFPLQLDLPSDALPQLESFNGIWQEVEIIPNLSALKNLRLASYPHFACEIPSICVMLRKLTSLASLEIWLDLNPTYYHNMAFCFLLASCPKLSHLEILCSSDPSFNIVSFAFDF